MNLSKHLTKTNLGILMLVVVVAYIMMICYRHQSKMLEEFTNDTATGTSLGNLDDNIMTCSDDLKDKLNYGSHKQKIDDLLVALHEHHNYNIMGHYVDYAKFVSNKDFCEKLPFMINGNLKQINMDYESDD